jgi:hypothetical protein
LVSHMINTRFALGPLSFVAGWILLAPLQAAKINEQMDVKAVREKLRAVRTELELLKGSVDRLESQKTRQHREISYYETSFEKQFREVLVPLLHWPARSAQVHARSWLEGQHQQYILLETRERLAREPLILIANRELALSELETKKTAVEDAVRVAEGKYSLLRLQAEELEYLHKRLSKAK